MPKVYQRDIQWMKFAFKTCYIKGTSYIEVNLDGNRVFKVHRYFQLGLEICS